MVLNIFLHYSSQHYVHTFEQPLSIGAQNGMYPLFGPLTMLFVHMESLPT